MDVITNALAECLRLCETSYQNHVKEMGKVTERDLQAWGIALNGLTPDQIRKAFLEHIQAKTYWPKPADIRGNVRFTRDRWDPTRALPEPSPRSKITESQKDRLNTLKGKIMEDPDIQKRLRNERVADSKRLRTQADRNPNFNPLRIKGDPETILKGLISTVQQNPNPREEEQLVQSIS